MRFEFATAGRILFGEGVLAEIGANARAYGATALVVTGATPARAAPVLAQLDAAGVRAAPFAIAGEPSVATVLAGAEAARTLGATLVIGFGGGSALDGAKAIAALATNPGEIYDYLEVIGRGKPLANPALPILAVPTTAGAGSEVTRNAVIFAPAERVKVSLRSPHMLPRLALVDPELTYSLPPAITATTGMDALTQLIEPFVSCRANLLTDGICRAGLRHAVRGLRRAYAAGDDVAARRDMAFASLSGGLALANAGLGAVHGFAGPIGGTFTAPHGAVCAALLAPVLRANLAALRARAPGHPALARMTEVACWLTGDSTATADDAAPFCAELSRRLAILGLGAWGVRGADVSGLVEKAAAASSMKGNPLPLTPAELAAALEAAL